MTSSEKNNNHKGRNEPFTHFIHKMDRLFSERPKGMLQSLDDFFSSAKERSFPVDLHETNSEYILTASLPGIARSQISIDLLTQAVTISANHVDSLATQHKTQGMFQKDLSASRLSRTISFPKPINERKVTARHRDGILTLHLPKVKGNRIEIND